MTSEFFGEIIIKKAISTGNKDKVNDSHPTNILTLFRSEF